MRRETRTVTITAEYNVFEVGEQVVVVDEAGGGRVYTVTEYLHPNLAAGERDGTVFVEGQQYGLSSEALQPAVEDQSGNERHLVSRTA